MDLQRIGSAWERFKRLPVMRTVFAVQERYDRDEAGIYAAALTYSGFLAIFPLLLLGLSILGYVLASHPALRTSIGERITGTVPGLGHLIGDNLSAVEANRAGTGIIGLFGLAWSGTGIVATAQQALARVFGFKMPGGVLTRAKQLATMALLGVIAVGSAVLAGLAGGSHGHGIAGIVLHFGGTLLSFVVDVGLFLAAYRILSQGHCPILARSLPGAVLAAGGWTSLKVAGSWYASRTVTNAHAVYGTFATTIGVLVLLSLGARSFMYGAEMIAVSIERGGRHAKEQADRQGRRRVSAA
jgi:YihY family inner membrane protein